MNRSAVRRFAAAARGLLLSAVTQQARACGITAHGCQTPAPSDAGMSAEEQELRRQLIEQIRLHGFSQTMEETACFWFIRFTALRFLEVNGYLPGALRVFTDRNDAFLPELLIRAETLDPAVFDQKRIAQLRAAGDDEALYRCLLLTVCKALHRQLPAAFDPVSWHALLLPSGLLQPDSIPGRMTAELPADDWRGQVEIIGWLYQSYNAEQKDRVFADLKRNIKISARTLPAATQLFTPKWIARCLVENSLGRIRAEGQGMPACADWRFYIPETGQTAHVRSALDRLRTEYRHRLPEQLKILDPCMGSGHILVCAFDVLMDLYTACGWTPQDAALSILRNNLYGLDIDKRAYQLAVLAVMMKARQYHETILHEPLACPHLASFSELAGQALPPALARQLRDADICGSLLKLSIPPGTDLPENSPVGRLSRILAQTYDAVITNPPYMGSSSMNPVLSAFVRTHYPDSKADLFACFIERCRELTAPHGFYALLTMQSWMFLLSFEQLRNTLLEDDVVNLIHLGSNAFEQGDVGTIVQAAAFVMRKTDLTDYRGTYIDLSTVPRPEDKIPAFFDRSRYYYISKAQFLRIPGHPFAYWANDRMLELFSGETLGSHAAPRQGMTTSDNERFVRRWFEPDLRRICFDAKDCADARRSGKKWFPYNKGGGYRKWYGNHEYVVNYEDDGRELKAFHAVLNKTRSGGRIKNTEYYFRRAIAWNFIALTPGFRFRPDGFMFDVAGSSLFTEDAQISYVLAFLCSNTASALLRILNPTMNFQANDIKSLPWIWQDRPEIGRYTQENIALCRADWDAFEISWDFVRHPLLPSPGQRQNACLRIADQFRIWEQLCDSRFRKLRANEEALNRIFLEIYGLQDDLSPAVDEKTVTVRRADLHREVRSLISYAVGCLFGRYSPDRGGIVCAGGAIPADACRTILPAPDGILPLCGGILPAADLTGRVIGFISTVYGADTLEENLSLIAGVLSTKGSPRDILQRYLQSGFYADHCRIYKKRPIYWLFSSGRKKAFQALVYLHRLTPATLRTLLTDYLQPVQAAYRAQLAELTASLSSAAPSAQQRIRKQAETCRAKLAEADAYAEKLRIHADAPPVLDLDDGVRANYRKLEDVLERIR